MAVQSYLALGANLGEPARAIHAALSRLHDPPAVRLIAASALYRTAPLGPPGQDPYLNLVCLITTTLPPHTLLERAKAIEAALGRQPGVRWGPRVIDVDLLVHGRTTLSSEALTLPHRELHQRRFVLAPWAELAPSLIVPGLDRTVRALLDLLPPADPEECRRLDPRDGSAGDAS